MTLWFVNQISMVKLALYHIVLPPNQSVSPPTSPTCLCHFQVTLACCVYFQVLAFVGGGNFPWFLITLKWREGDLLSLLGYWNMKKYFICPLVSSCHGAFEGLGYSYNM